MSRWEAKLPRCERIRPPNLSSLVSHDEFNERLIVKLRVCPLSTGQHEPPPPLHKNPSDNGRSAIHHHTETRDIEAEKRREGAGNGVGRGSPCGGGTEGSSSLAKPRHAKEPGFSNPSETSQRCQRLTGCVRCWTKFPQPQHPQDTGDIQDRYHSAGETGETVETGETGETIQRRCSAAAAAKTLLIATSHRCVLSPPETEMSTLPSGQDNTDKQRTPEHTGANTKYIFKNTRPAIYKKMDNWACDAFKV